MAQGTAVGNGHKEINWVTSSFIALFHLGAVAALFFFSWSALAVAAFLYWLSLSLGIGMGYHRLLTHRGFKVPKVIEYFLAVCGTLALEGGPLFWVATHRVHHANSDRDGDPHSPRHGAWWSHAGWILTGDALHDDAKILGRFAPDLANDRVHMWLSKWHWVPLTTLGFVLLALGGWSWVLWGIFFRVTVGLHATWLVNSACHIWGGQRFESKDDSRNNWWVALLTFGEGWHNNHHAHPSSARHGLAWHEFDPTWILIRMLQALGLARNVKAASLTSRGRLAPVPAQATDPEVSQAA
jgi:fatty-acid desaturase